MAAPAPWSLPCVIPLRPGSDSALEQAHRGFMGDLSSEAVRSLLRDVCSDGTVHAGGPGYDGRVEWRGLTVRATARGTNIGKLALVLAADLGVYLEVANQVPIVKLLEHAASNASVRLVLSGEDLVLETSIVWDEVSPERCGEIVRGRLNELHAVATAWRTRIAPRDSSADLQVPTTLDELKRGTRPAPDAALHIAAVAFGAAGADGVISDAERERLRGWLRDVPAFASIEYPRLTDAIGRLADDPGRALLEAARRLGLDERLFAWGLANEMAFADGFAADPERRYLSNVASAFRLTTEMIAPLAAEMQQRAVARETREPPPPRPR